MKKLLGSILLLTLIVSMCSMAYAKTFSDVKNTKYATSVDILSTLKIVDGYQDGTFKPNNTITRAELSKLIIVSLGKEKTAESLKGSTSFNDVAANSWASGYINCASSLNIIKGYPDGSFKPSNPVTYVEAATMLLRSLNYTRELESEKYPTGYMKRANDAGILDNVSATSSTENAIRGNVAIMVLNTLCGNVRKIVSTTSSGTATWGDGTPLIEQNFDDYRSVKGGIVSDIDFEKSVITVKDETQNRKVRCYIDGQAKLSELYKREINFLYDDENDEFLLFSFADDYTVKEVDVKEIDDDEKVLYDEKDNEYDLPKDILMVWVSKYKDVETAYIVYDGKKIIAMVLEGDPEVFAGIVTDTGIKVDGEKGFEIQNTDQKYEELPFADEEKLSIGEVVLYMLDNKGRAVIIERIAKKNCLGIEELTTTAIKLKKETKINLTSDFVYLVDLNGNIREGKLKDIEKEFDLAYTVKFAELYFIVVFEDSVNSDDIVSNLSVSEAKEELEDVIKAANKLIKKESSYSVASFEAFRTAVNEGNAALKSNGSAAKMELAARKIKEAQSGLKSATSSDKQLRSDYSNLQSIIKEAEGKKQADYTAASFKTLTDELKNAKAVNLANTTSAKISDRITALRKAINSLVTNTANDEINKAINNLNALISKGNTIVSNKANYSTESYNKFYSTFTTVKNFKTTNASLSEIKTQANNLEAAIDQLVPVLLATYKTNRDTLDNTYRKANSIKQIDYTQDSYEEFDDAFKTLKTEYSNLKSVSEVEELSNQEVQTELTKVNKLNTDINNAMNKLVVNTLRSNLRKYVEKGESYTASTWSGSIDYTALKGYVTAARVVVDDVDATDEQLREHKNKLSDYISL